MNFEVAVSSIGPAPLPPRPPRLCQSSLRSIVGRMNMTPERFTIAGTSLLTRPASRIRTPLLACSRRNDALASWYLRGRSARTLMSDLVKRPLSLMMTRMSCSNFSLSSLRLVATTTADGTSTHRRRSMGMSYLCGLSSPRLAPGALLSGCQRLTTHPRNRSREESPQRLRVLPLDRPTATEGFKRPNWWQSKRGHQPDRHPQPYGGRGWSWHAAISGRLVPLARSFRESVDLISRIGEQLAGGRRHH
jgi:hypothetical protein